MCYGSCLIFTECARHGHLQKHHHLTTPRMHSHPQPLPVQEKYPDIQRKKRHLKKKRSRQFCTIRLRKRAKKHMGALVRQGARDVAPQPLIGQDSRVSPVSPPHPSWKTRRVSSFFTNSHTSSRDVEKSCALTSEQRGHKRTPAHPASSVRSQAVDAGPQTQRSPGLTDGSHPSSSLVVWRAPYQLLVPASPTLALPHQPSRVHQIPSSVPL